MAGNTFCNSLIGLMGVVAFSACIASYAGYLDGRQSQIYIRQVVLKYDKDLSHKLESDETRLLLYDLVPEKQHNNPHGESYVPFALTELKYAGLGWTGSEKTTWMEMEEDKLIIYLGRTGIEKLLGRKMK